MHYTIAQPTPYNGVRLHRFKLLLDDTEETQYERQRTATILEELGLTVEDAIAQYLVLVLEHTVSKLTAHHSHARGLPVQLVATVPAIWDGRARTVMIRALERAAHQVHFGDHQDIFLVSEPDAAATSFCESELNPGLKARNIVGVQNP